MGYSQFSTLITNAPKFVDPLSENTLVRGSMLAEQNAQLAKNETQANIDPIFNIKPVSLADEKVLRQKQDELKSALGNINMSQLSNPQTKGQINSIINQFKNDQDILGIATRSAQANKILEAKKEADAKGQTYIDDGLEDMQKYTQDGVYLRDKRFNSNGFIAPDVTKELDEIAKNTPEVETWKTRGGYDDSFKEKSQSALYNKYITHFTQDPKLAQYYNHLAEKRASQVNLDDVVNNPTSQIATLFPHLDPTSQQQAIATMQQLQSMKDNPYYQGLAKQKLKEDIIKDEAAKAAEAYHTISQTGHKANEFAIKAQEHTNRQLEDMYKAKLEAGLITDPSTGKPIPGKAEIAGETALLKAKAKDGTSSPVHISNDVHNFHENLQQKNPENIVRDASTNKPVEITLESKLWDKLIGKGDETKEGWHQLSHDDFLQHFKDFSKIGGVNSIVQPVYENGYPAVYVKGEGKNAKMLMKVRNGNETSSPTEYRVVDASGIYTAAIDKEKLTKGQREALSTPEARKANLTGNYEIDNSQTPSNEPIKLKGNEDPKTFIVGKLYEHNGKKGRWNGKNFVQE